MGDGVGVVDSTFMAYLGLGLKMPTCARVTMRWACTGSGLGVATEAEPRGECGATTVDASDVGDVVALGD
jgi:hypothetical protein